MIVRVDPQGAIRLQHADDLRRFSVSMADTEASRAGLATVARLDGAECAWFEPARVSELAGPQPPGWQEQFDAMVAYAAGKGWTDAAGALRAHIVFD